MPRRRRDVRLGQGREAGRRRALSELVAEGQLSLDDALAEAERILWRSATEIYGIDPVAQMKRLGG